MGNKRSILALMLVVLFAVILLPPATVGAQTKTLIVPDQYPTIQAAVDSAGTGDTVFVRSGKYVPEAKNFTGAVEDVSVVVINKSISLVGENASKTIIDLQFLNLGVGVYIKAPDVTVSGFTIQNYDVGILVGTGGPPSSINTPSNSHIEGNKLLNGDHGIWVEGGIGFNISNNELINNRSGGIYLYPMARDGTIIGNRLSGRGNICLEIANNITVANNTLYNTIVGLTIISSSQVNVYGNNITKNTKSGILLAQYCDHVTVYANNITGNSVGIEVDSFHRPQPDESWAIPELKEYYSRQGYSNNSVYLNNFVENSVQVSVSPTDNWSTVTDVVSWDNSVVGNFWSDYQSKYPNASEIGSSGIGNVPYVIDVNNTDRFPIWVLADSSAPGIEVLLPENKSYATNSIQLNLTVNERTSEIVYSLDGHQNVTITDNTTLTGLEAGLHNITIYAQDIFGNVGASETITFKTDPFPILVFIAVTGILASVIAAIGIAVYVRRRRISSQQIP
jgi:parallel beta-helix repeat protein